MKKILYGLLTGVFVLVAAGCSFERPEKISIKTGASYKFTIAEMEKDLTDLSPINQFLEANEGSAGLDLYLYEPENAADSSMKDVQTLILSKTLSEIPIDMSSYLNSGMLDQIAAIDFEREFKIEQDLTTSFSKEIDISKLNDLINTGVVIGGYGAGPLSFTFVDGNGFTSINYAAGYLEVKPIEGSGITPSGSITIKENENVISTGVFRNGSAKLPLTNVSLKATGMSIEFSDMPFPFVGTITENSQIKSVEGLSLSSTILDELNPLTVSFEIPAAEGSGIEEIAIGEGNIKTKMITEGWSDGIFAYSIALEGGINVNVSGDDTDESVESLNNVTYENKKIKATASLSLSFLNSTLDFTKSPEFKFDMNISKIASATVKLPDNFDANFDTSFDLPAEAQTIVNSIKWGKSGIKMTCSNTFPTGNTIGLNVKSDYFHIPSDSGVITCGAVNEKLEFMSSVSEFTHTSADSIDLRANFTLPGWNAEKKTITIKNVEANKPYSLKMKVEPVLNWKEISIDSSLATIADQLNTNLNVKALTKSLLSSVDPSLQDALGLGAANVFIFCDIPEISGLRDATFNGVIKASIGKEDESNNFVQNPSVDPVYFLGSSSGSENLPLKTAPALKFSETKKKTVTTNVETAYGSSGIDITPIINANCEDDESLFIDYDVSFKSGNENEIKITPEVFDNTDVKNVKVSVMVIVPISIKALGNIDFDIMKLVKPDWDSDPTADLLGRSPDDGSGNNSGNGGILDNPLELIEKVVLDYKLNELPFEVGENVRFVIDMDGDGTEFEPQELSLSEDSLELNPAAIMETNPLRPSIKLVLPEDSELALKQTMKVAANLKLEIKTSGKLIPLMGGND